MTEFSNFVRASIREARPEEADEEPTDTAPEPTAEEKLLTEIRDLLKK